jgi:hypothetical protein
LAQFYNGNINKRTGEIIQIELKAVTLTRLGKKTGKSLGHDCFHRLAFRIHPFPLPHVFAPLFILFDLATDRFVIHILDLARHHIYERVFGKRHLRK